MCAANISSTHVCCLCSSTDEESGKVSILHLSTIWMQHSQSQGGTHSQQPSVWPTRDSLLNRKLCPTSQSQMLSSSLSLSLLLLQPPAVAVLLLTRLLLRPAFWVASLAACTRASAAAYADCRCAPPALAAVPAAATAQLLPLPSSLAMLLASSAAVFLAAGACTWAAHTDHGEHRTWGKPSLPAIP